MNKYTFACDPVANPSSVYSDTTHEWSEDGASVFAINRNFARPEFSVKDNGDQLETITPNIHVRYDKNRFSPSGFSIAFTSKVTLC
ncbi:hypothetical protein E4U24_001979 [Claviceps purpurea]|nr:hypothetical protein E4U12_005165 [Claviceps purpurea]KAG6164672.1 hypothetical protein E4U11_001024 [Claviceps purpurea]KAG6228295.1 hypothetical protein E4U34_004586 [Claviceps purpurea]KAG6249760.1 hypothetical protein E4U24_001979 [Claviceps purpurea]KAG6286512.1 hypothetical protein E4U46_004802 [Claviceps purpurea]